MLVELPKLFTALYLESSYKKSDNLQYNKLVRWVPGTNDSSTQRLMFQVFFFFFHDFLQNSLHKLLQFIDSFVYKFTKITIKSL